MQKTTKHKLNKQLRPTQNEHNVLFTRNKCLTKKLINKYKTMKRTD